jgi:signal transduction histidine kinase
VLPGGSYFDVGRRLTLTLAVLIAVILAGNGLVILQFERARQQTNRLTGVTQQLTAVMRLQQTLLSFHERMNEIMESRDVPRLRSEANELRTALMEQTRRTRTALAYLPPEFHFDPTFLTALDTIETTLPQQIGEIVNLGAAGDWEDVRLRLDNELHHIEATTSALVRSIDRDLDEELPRVVGNMRAVQKTILVIVPVTAISTVLIAAFFGWAIARRILELRVEERVNERTRIARDLHDTLLQSFQGVLLEFSAVQYRIPDRPEVVEMLESVTEHARQAITKGRDAVEGLRSSKYEGSNLEAAISGFGQELAASQPESHSPDFRVNVQGTTRSLGRIVANELYYIATEALRNAFQHAQARRIEVEIWYHPREFRLRVRDNGKGIDPKILRGGRDGHYGITGMRERARLAGGKLVFWSQLDSGTELELTFPASLAYAKESDTGA